MRQMKVFGIAGTGLALFLYFGVQVDYSGLFSQSKPKSAPQKNSDSKPKEKEQVSKQIKEPKKTQPAWEGPNELGKILILTYHKLGDEDTEYTRTRVGFRSDMVYLIQNGYVPISVRELASGRINVPKGKRPVLISFDDSSIYQFEMDRSGKISPNSGIGILEELKKVYPQFVPKAVFFVTPGAKQPNNLFGQNEFRKEKMEYLQKNGYEIENHTHWHANLKQYSNLIEEQIAKCQKEVSDYLPGHKMIALALPYGIYPKDPDRPRLWKGEYKGVSYSHLLIFDYSNRLSYSPYDEKFDPMYVRRVHGNAPGVKRAFSELEKSGVGYVSDGNPDTISVPKSRHSQVHPKWKSKLVVLDDQAQP
jgi:peptidoglycan/xylan/chitin deacetylase (PgdA/CDA1 family)